MALEDDIQEIKRETTESHNLIIKTDNLVKNLSSELRKIQKKQERYERKYIFNSVVAYVIFVVVIFGGLYVAFDAKVGVVRREKEALEEQLQKTEAKAKELQKRLSIRGQQEKTAERFLRLKKDNRNLDALKVAESLDPNLISPLLERLVTREAEELRQQLGNESLQAGKVLYSRGQLKRSLRELNRALEVKPPAPLLAMVYHQRGVVLQKLNRIAQAAESFMAAANADPLSPGVDDALFMAAGALETSGDVPRALTVYARLLRDHEKSKYAAQARRRVARLTKSGPPVEPPIRPRPEESPESKRKPPPPKPEPPAPKPVDGGSQAQTD
jgi:tetratricopeptide (TPR) repeat protein